MAFKLLYIQNTVIMKRKKYLKGKQKNEALVGILFIHE